MTSILTIAAIYSSFIGSNGFAGFDLAPIVSLAQAMYVGQSFHDFIDNVFSPGFAVILKLMAIIHGGVTWNLFTNGLIIYTFIFAIVGTYYHLNSQKSNIIIFYAFLFAAILPLITDGFILVTLLDCNNSLYLSF